MDSVQVDCDLGRELDDSGCVQDDSIHNGFGQVGLLDLSDDVLLYILRHLSPRDLKALGFSCLRLGRLVRERSLWRHVDARSEACSRARLKWYLDNTLHRDTQHLMISGYAKDAEGCHGLFNVTRKEAEDEKRQSSQREGRNISANICDLSDMHPISIPVQLERHHARFFISAQQTTHLPRFRGYPSWPEDGDGDRGEGRGGEGPCRGPQFSLSRPLLKQLAVSCPQLTTLALDYCNIHCDAINLSHFPKTLKKLSLRGTKCFNMTIDKSFLFKIQDYMPGLEILDVSECEWMEPATLLPLSKLSSLQELYMRECPKLAEFVAYASLTARYGFRTLKVLDLRGAPVGDSEVSALGWLPRLERLWLGASAAGARPPRRTPHAHYADDPPARHRQLCDWEMQEPDYFKSKSNPESNTEDTAKEPAEPMDATDSSQQDASQNQRPGPSNTDRRPPKEGSMKRKLVEQREVSIEISIEAPVRKRQRTSENNQQASESNTPGDNGESSGQNTFKNDEEGKEIREENVSNNGGASKSDSKDERDAIKDDKQNKKDGGDNPQNRNSPDCIVDCIKIDQLIDVGELRCGRQNEVIVIASSSRAKVPNPSTSEENAESSSSKGGYVRFRQNRDPEYINIDANENKAESCDKMDDSSQVEGEKSKNDKEHPSSSKNDSTDSIKDGESSEKDGEEDSPSDNINKGASTSKDNAKSDEPKEKYVRFRKNQDPVFVNCAPEPQNQRREPLPPVQYQIEPRHHVLYVSVGPHLNTYRFPRDSSELDRHFNMDFRPHVESSLLVTDFAIRRFGRADGEDVNIIHIGPNGPMVVGHDTGSRPERSSLRFLSVTGYRNITDRSLVHLATSAPNLTHIDFSGTSVSDSGAENFRSLRPDCELIYSPYVDKEKQ